MATATKANTTRVDFDDIEDGEYRYSGVAFCTLHRGCRDSRDTPGEGAKAEVSSVVLYQVDHFAWGHWGKWEPPNDDCTATVKLYAIAALHADAAWQRSTVEYLSR